MANLIRDKALQHYLDTVSLIEPYKAINTDYPIEIRGCFLGEPLFQTIFIVNTPRQFLADLKRHQSLEIVNETLHCIEGKLDSTLLLKALPSLSDFKKVLDNLGNDYDELLQLVIEWKSNGANQIELTCYHDMYVMEEANEDDT